MSVVRGLLRRLDRHWFAPAPLRDLALARIVVVGAQLVFFLPPLEEARWWARVPDARLFLPLPALKALMWPFGGWGARPTPELVSAVWWAAVAAGVLAVAGLFTRASLFTFAAANTFLVAHSYSYGQLHHPEAPLVITLWLLALGPSGAALSVDALRRRARAAVRAMRFVPQGPRPSSPLARWPLRTVQWLLVLVYFSAGYSKLRYGGLAWFNGHTLAYYLVQDGLRWGREAGLTLASFSPIVLSALSVTVVAFELTFGLAVLVPALASLYLAVGAATHIGIDSLMAAPFWQFIVLYVVFLGCLRGVPVPGRAGVRSAPDWSVIYDGRCPRCLRAVVLLDALDWRRRLRFVELGDAERAGHAVPRADLERAMHVVGPRGATHAGFHAFRALARRLPPLWPLVPLLWLPPVERAGVRVYGWLARRRRRAGCEAGTCALVP